MIEFNMNKEDVQSFLDLIKANEGYCPCRLEKTPENKCMCLDFKNQKSGVCHCGLFRKD